MKAQDKYMRAIQFFQRRIDVVSRGRQFYGFLPLNDGKLVPVGGPRNRRGVLPKGTRMGIKAAYLSGLRAQKEGEALMAQLRGGSK